MAAEIAMGLEGPVARAQARDRRRWRDAFDRGVVAVASVPRLASHAFHASTRATRNTWRRVETASATTMPAQRAAGFLTFGSGLPEAAAAAATAIALGIGTGGAPPSEPVPVAALSDHVVVATAPDPSLPTEVSDPPVELEPVRPVLGADRRESPKATEPSPRPAIEGEPSIGPGPAPTAPVPVSPPTARLDGDPADLAEGPIRATPDQHGETYYVTPGVEASADTNDDGQNDVGIQSPSAGWGCAPPGERGTSGGVVCPMLEQSGLPSKSWGE